MVDEKKPAKKPAKKAAAAGKAGGKKQGSWHDQFKGNMTFGQKAANALALGMGSWAFIIIQSCFVACWMVLNAIALIHHWDAYPFILLNLLFSIQAAYAAPIIMMSQNQQNERDRAQARKDMETDTRAKNDIEALQKTIARLEVEKLDKILEALESMGKA